MALFHFFQFYSLLLHEKQVLQKYPHRNRISYPIFLLFPSASIAYQARLSVNLT